MSGLFSFLLHLFLVLCLFFGAFNERIANYLVSNEKDTKIIIENDLSFIVLQELPYLIRLQWHIQLASSDGWQCYL